MQCSCLEMAVPAKGKQRIRFFYPVQTKPPFQNIKTAKGPVIKAGLFFYC